MTIAASDLGLYALGILLLWLTPGPVWVAVTARALAGGFRAAWPLAVGVSLLVLPHVASIFLSNEVISTAFASRGVCLTPDTPERYAAFFPCISATAWVHPSPLLHGYRLVPHRHVRLRALLVVLLVACACAWLGRESREPARS